MKIQRGRSPMVPAEEEFAFFIKVPGKRGIFSTLPGTLQAFVDLAGREQKKPAFLALNPRGEVPVIEDGATVIWDSGACLVYLARRHGGEQWLPLDPAAMAGVQQWLALAATEIQIGLQYTRRGGPQDCRQPRCYSARMPASLTTRSH